jgi:hypothetical protein
MEITQAAKLLRISKVALQKKSQRRRAASDPYGHCKAKVPLPKLDGTLRQCKVTLAINFEPEVALTSDARICIVADYDEIVHPTRANEVRTRQPHE